MLPRVILITGASSGIGRAAALMLLARGHRVHAGARRTEAMADLAARGARVHRLDVTDDASMREAVDGVLAEEGRLDALVNNAGYGSYGAVEDLPMDEARRQVEVNLFGLARMTQLVLPHMRARRTGTIINISSVGGTIWTPLGAWYHATKWAVEGFTHALRLEIAQFGLQAVLVAPGGIRTEFGGITTDGVLRTSGQGAYARLAQGLARTASGRLLGSPPEVVARAITAAVEARRPRTIYRPGQYAQTLVALRRVLPDRAMDRLLLTFAR